MFQKSHPIQINYKNANSSTIYYKESDLVYEKIKKQFNEDNDILIVSQEQVCYFDETFLEFKNRISQDQDQIIYVKSLKEIYNELIDIQNKFNTIEIAYKSQNLICDQIKQLNQEYYQQLQGLEIDKQKSQFSIITSDGSQKIIKEDKIIEQLLITKIEQKKYEEKKSLLSSNSQLCVSSYQIDPTSDSQLLSVIETCFLCNNYIDQKIIQLTCYHKFHEECLASLFLGQISNQNKELNCLCKIKQNTSILQQIEDQNIQRLLRHKLLQNQLNELIQINNLEKCQTPACFFYFKKNDQLQQKHSYCPLCLI